MSPRPNTDDYRQLFINDVPLMDVRAPIEFEKGAFPCSINIPLLDDEQRQLIGTRYKEQGQDAAIELGWQLATPELQTQRVHDWKQFVQAHALYSAYVEKQPLAAAGWNNLAYTLMQLQCRTASLQAIRCALQLEPENPAWLDSRRELSAQADATSGSFCEVPAC
jgi:hypothetical protein